MRKLPIILTFIVGLFACEPNQNVDSPELREQTENRKIKQIHEPEILARALKIGKEIALESETTLEKALKLQIKENGIEQKITFFNLNTIPLIQKLEKKFDVIIRRVSLKNENSQNKPDEIEFKLLDSYLYNEENGIESTDNIQKIGKEYIYVKPIFVKELYADDLTTGYNVGDLRGMWSIVMKKKKIVLAISDDTWKHKKLRNPRTK